MNERLIIFTRYPVPGMTKTRLIPELGPVRAAELHKQITEKTLDTAINAAALKGIRPEIHYTGGDLKNMRSWLGSDIPFQEQCQGDIGSRMYNSLIKAFENGSRQIILIGTDIPEIMPDHILSGFDFLSNHDVVLGPSTDGGYWLISLKKPVNLFSNINWGTGEVLKQTIDAAVEKGLSVHLLEPLTDLDQPKDLKAIALDKQWKRPYISVVIPALNEEDKIKEVISNARDDEVEVIVIDGGSTDRTKEIAVETGAKVLNGPCSRATQQNLGAGIATGRILLFLHADTLLPKDYKICVFRALMDTDVKGGAFRFRTDSKKLTVKLVEFCVNLRSRWLNLPYGDQGLFMKKELFDFMGGFPAIPIAEDVLLIRRLKRQGSIRIAPSYVVTSARRWCRLGIFRTTLINQLILLGLSLKIDPEKLAALYKR
ncbi:MAG: TIGR04283 family arsenosugar biosynthesis glycosyltransferase [Deltaproteobacteria bacterium]|nr:TIGR04283 family arsenosugar biosynthesis glycosyltransferase [Deltaproteobacteria bacterium]